MFQQYPMSCYLLNSSHHFNATKWGQSFCNEQKKSKFTWSKKNFRSSDKNENKDEIKLNKDGAKSNKKETKIIVLKIEVKDRTKDHLYMEYQLQQNNLPSP